MARRAAVSAVAAMVSIEPFYSRLRGSWLQIRLRWARFTSRARADFAAARKSPQAGAPPKVRASCCITRFLFRSCYHNIFLMFQAALRAATRHKPMPFLFACARCRHRPRRQPGFSHGARYFRRFMIARLVRSSARQPTRKRAGDGFLLLSRPGSVAIARIYLYHLRHTFTIAADIS